MTDSPESVMRIGGNTGQLTDSDESVMRIGGNTGQLTDSGESVMRIGGNTGQLTDSRLDGELSMKGRTQYSLSVIKLRRRRTGLEEIPSETRIHLRA